MSITKERVELVINHFRSYQYGEPYEGKPVGMARAFDIANQDAQVILSALDLLKNALALGEPIRKIAEIALSMMKDGSEV